MQPQADISPKKSERRLLNRRFSDIDQQCSLLQQTAAQTQLTPQENSEVCQTLCDVQKLREKMLRVLRRAFSQSDNWKRDELVKVVPTVRDRVATLDDRAQREIARIVHPQLLDEKRQHRDVKGGPNEKDRFNWEVSSALAEMLTSSAAENQADLGRLKPLAPIAAIVEILSLQDSSHEWAKSFEDIRKTAERVSQRLDRLLRALTAPFAPRSELSPRTKCSDHSTSAEPAEKHHSEHKVPLIVRRQALWFAANAPDEGVTSAREVESLEQAAKRIGVEIHILEENLLSRTEQTFAYIRLRQHLHGELQTIMQEIEDARDRMRTGPLLEEAERLSAVRETAPLLGTLPGLNQSDIPLPAD